MDINLIKALSDPTRLAIIEELTKRTRCGRSLALKMGLSESAICQHLRILRDAGLVEGIKFGYYTHYRLNRDRLAALRDQLSELIDTPRQSGKIPCDQAENVGCLKYVCEGEKTPC